MDNVLPPYRRLPLPLPLGKQAIKDWVVFVFGQKHRWMKSRTLRTGRRTRPTPYQTADELARLPVVDLMPNRSSIYEPAQRIKLFVGEESE